MSLSKTAEPHSERADDRQASEGGIGPFSFALFIALLVFVSFPNVVLGTQTLVLEVPPGRHVVRIVDEDTTFRTGLVLSAAGLVTLVCMALRRNSPNAESVAAG